MFAIRRLLPHDAPAYCELRRRAVAECPWAFLATPHEDTSSVPEIVAARIADPENAIVAAAAESDPTRLLAIAGVYREPREKVRHRATIWGVYCAPEVRARGLGRAVMRAAIDVARSWPGVHLVHLSVSARSPEAQALYESLGFVRWGIEPDALMIDDASADEHHMQLRLNGIRR